MKFALVNNIKSEATKGVVGFCQCCGFTLIAKCGAIKVNHWAHKGRRVCDKWWESETDWHRSWKNKFPTEWQETVMYDDGKAEKHIADVRTIHGLTIEFQHSYINRKEQKSRERFYKNMVWIVNGARLKYDYPRFLKEKRNFKTTDIPQIHAVEFVEECFPKNWTESNVPVIFDFQNVAVSQNQEDLRNKLYCLFPQHLGRLRILAELSRPAFINKIKEGDWSQRVSLFMKKIHTLNESRKRQEKFINFQASQKLFNMRRVNKYRRKRL